MVKKTHLLIAVISSGLLSISPYIYSATELYQWVDENGVKHFSQQPPAHMPDLKAVNVRGTPVVSEDKYALPAKEMNSATNTEQTSEQLEIGQPPQKDRLQCDKARQSIAQIQQSGRIRSRDTETGEVSYLSEEEKQSQLDRWQNLEKIYC